MLIFFLQLKILFMYFNPKKTTTSNKIIFIFAKTKNMNKILSISLFVSLSSFFYGQTSHKFEEILIKTTPQKITEKSNRKYGYEYEVLEIKNTSSEQKTILFHTDAYYDGICSTCTNSEYTFSFVLKPNETITGSLKDAANKGLYVFKKDHNGKITNELTELKFSNVVIK